MKTKNVLLLCGGASEERVISLKSANHFATLLKQINNVKIYQVEIKKSGAWHNESGESCSIIENGKLVFNGNEVFINFAVPCFHGVPGESGDIQSLFEFYNIPYLGTGPEASTICFNKVTTKLWLDKLGIPNAPYIFLQEDTAIEQKRALEAFGKWKDVFVKASHQGSSIGIYNVTEEKQLANAVSEAFKVSPYVLIEKSCKGRDLEVSSYTYEGKLYIANPGEVAYPDAKFYDYDTKYAPDSSRTNIIEADIPEDIRNKIISYAETVFKALKLRHLARIDFLLTEEGEIILNECNTFPGHTAKSMFPKMMENNGHPYVEFLDSTIKRDGR